MNNLNVIILAADGPSFGGKELPACLQILKGGTTLLDYQIRTLNLCGIDLQNIFIVVGKEGLWSKNNLNSSLNKYSKENLVINNINESTSSEESFLLGIERINESLPLIVINGDLLFDTHHIEQLIQLKNQDVCFTKKAYFINEKGIQILVQNNNLNYLNYYGLINAGSLNSINKTCEKLESL